MSITLEPTVLPIATTLVRDAGVESGWPQIGLHKHKDRVFIFFSEKREHGGVEAAVWMQEGVDRGYTVDVRSPVKILGPYDRLNPLNITEVTSRWGYDAGGSAIVSANGAVLFIPIAKKTAASSLTWHLIRKHVGDLVVTSESAFRTTQGSSNFTIERSDLDLIVWKGMTVNFPNGPAVNGLGIDGTWTILQTTSTTITLGKENVAPANSTGPGNPARRHDIEINATGWHELFFPNGENLGEALITEGTIPAPPSIIHGGNGVPADNGKIIFGATGGNPSPKHFVLTGLLSDVADPVQSVTRYNTFIGFTQYTEPAPVYHGPKVATFIRTNDDAFSPQFGIAPNDTTEPNFNAFTATGWGEESPIFMTVVPTPAGDRIFAVATDDRSPETDVLTTVPIYLLTALFNDAEANGPDVFKFYKIGDALWRGQIDNQATGIQIGGLCVSRTGDSLITHYSEEIGIGYAQPTSSVVMLQIDISQWTQPPTLKQIEKYRSGLVTNREQLFLKYIGIPDTIDTPGSVWAPSQCMFDSAFPRYYDPKTGIFTAPKDDLYTFIVSPYYNALDLNLWEEVWLELYDVDGGLPHNFWLNPLIAERIASFQAGRGGNRIQVTHITNGFLHASQRVQFRTAGAGKVLNDTGRNLLTIKRGL